MPALTSLLATVVAGFALGALPWGLWLGRWFRGIDVREHGSRNLGATNVYRVLGPPLGIATLALDVAKGALPVWGLPRLEALAAFPGGREWCAVTAGLAAVAGHLWTPFAGFRGGKGVATTVGVLLALSPIACGVFVLVFVAAVAVTRFVSVGSTLGSLAFVATLWALSPQGWRSPSVLLGALLALMVILRHRENYRRLARGEERRFSLRRETRPA